jgi:DNA-directed RNA polymerase specialized sigma24 family protein
VNLGGAISEQSERVVGAALRRCAGSRHLRDDLLQVGVMAAWLAERRPRPAGIGLIAEVWPEVRGRMAALLRAERRNRRWCGAKAAQARQETPGHAEAVIDRLWLEEAMAGLTDDERAILRRAYWQGLPCGSSGERKRRRKAEARLRELLRA